MNLTSSTLQLALAFHLPQFHQIPENDEWWGEGFTEWTKLKTTNLDSQRQWPLRLPVEPLGWYNLLDARTLESQQVLAEKNGIDGFAVWTYWFGNGRRLLEKPMEKVVKENLRFRHCIAWANHSWLNRKNGRQLIEQKYLGEKDYREFFESMRSQIESENYILVDGKPVLFIYRPNAIPDLPVFMETWREEAAKSGWPGLYIIGDVQSHEDVAGMGLDAHTVSTAFWSTRKKLFINYFKEKLRTKTGIETTPQVYKYWTMVKDSFPSAPSSRYIPTILTGWDTTPRHGRNGVVFREFTVESFRRHLADASSCIDRMRIPPKIVLVKSWNEWAEQNILEPDSLFGDQMLAEFAAFKSSLCPAPGEFVHRTPRSSTAPDD